MEYLNTSVPIISLLESYLNIPNNTIIAIRDEALKIYYHSEQPLHDKLKSIAEMSREKLFIAKNNSNLLFQIEKSGIHVIEKNVGERQRLIVHGEKMGKLQL